MTARVALADSPTVQSDDLLELFADTAYAVRRALAPMGAEERRGRGNRSDQYALDLVADAAALEVLHDAPVAIVSEESGCSGDPDAAITVVIDPVDGSTNCSIGLPYWAISLCAVDADGPFVGLVTNQVTESSTHAVRGKGVWRDGEPVRVANRGGLADAIVAISGMPAQPLDWNQFRALGSIALSLCDLAAGHLDGYLDAVGDVGPWDYLAGMLAVQEAGGCIVDATGRDLAITDPGARRQVLAASNQGLLDELHGALTPGA